MKTLGDLSLDHALESPESARAALNHAVRFTDRFREVEDLPAAEREAELLRVQFPACLQPIAEGDLFVGRIFHPMAGLSPESPGLGCYFLSSFAEAWMAHAQATPGEVRQCRDLIEFWKPRMTQARVRAAFSPGLRKILPSDECFTQSGVAFPLYRIAGTILDYGKLLSLGLDGLEKLGGSAVANAGNSLAGAGQAVVQTLKRSIDFYLANPTKASSSPSTVMDVLLAIRTGRPPESLREAIQLFWLYVIHSGTWNYGRLDVVLGPFLQRDLSAGLITESSACDLLCSLWALMHAYSNQYNNRVIVGGMGRCNEEAADQFALLAIAATRRVRLNQPQLSLRFYKGQNPQLWERALDAIGEGCTYPMLYNDDVNIPAVAKAFNVQEEMAANYVPYGCGEYVLGHFSIGTPNGLINLLKALEVALRAGVDPMNGRHLAEIPSAGEFHGFEDVWAAYTRVIDLHIEALAEQEKLVYDITGREMAFLFISLLTSDCVERNLPLLSGGVRYLGGTLEAYGNINAANSLHVIEELVFRSRKVTLVDLVSAMDADFVGYEELRQKCLAVAKYGNDEGGADAMARRVHEHICRKTRDMAARMGLHNYLIVLINNAANTTLGRNTGASAEGRRSGQPMANANNPTPGSDTSGVTAFLNSLAGLDPGIHAGAVQNMKFNKEWFGAMRPKLDALLHAYFEQGGTQAMITVVDRGDMEAAMREPEKWGHLMVRVGGFSIHFVDLPHDIQLEVVERTLN